MKQPEMEKEPEMDRPPEKEKHRAEKQEPAKPGHDKPAEKPAGIVQPMIDDLRYPKDAPQPPKAPPRGLIHPPQPEPAELDQDPGGGYNPDGTFPQT